MKFSLNMVKIIVPISISILSTGCGKTVQNSELNVITSDSYSYMFEQRRLCEHYNATLYKLENGKLVEQGRVLQGGTEFVMTKWTHDKEWAEVWHEGKAQGWIRPRSGMCHSINFTTSKRKVCDTVTVDMKATNSASSKTIDMLQGGHLIDILRFSNDGTWAKIKTSVHYDGKDTNHTAWIPKSKICTPYTFHEVIKRTNFYYIPEAKQDKKSIDLHVGMVLIGIERHISGKWIKAYASHNNKIIEGWAFLPRLKATNKEFKYPEAPDVEPNNPSIATTQETSPQPRGRVPYFYQGFNKNRPRATCNITTTAMAISYKLGRRITPDQIYTDAHGKRRGKKGVVYTSEEQALIARQYGVSGSKAYTGVSADFMKRQLDQGHPISMQGHFTNRRFGHIILITGYNNKGWIVHDPYGLWTLKTGSGSYVNHVKKNGRGQVIKFYGKNVIYPYDKVSSNSLIGRGKYKIAVYKN